MAREFQCWRSGLTGCAAMLTWKHPEQLSGSATSLQFEIRNRETCTWRWVLTPAMQQLPPILRSCSMPRKHQEIVILKNVCAPEERCLGLTSCTRHRLTWISTRWVSPELASTYILDTVTSRCSSVTRFVQAISSISMLIARQLLYWNANTSSWIPSATDP